MFKIKGRTMAEIIGTTSNKTYKYIKSLQQKKKRIAEQSFTVEGIKSVSDAIRSDMTLQLIAVSETFYNHEAFDYPQDIKTVIIKSELFDGLCDTKTPQGIIAVIKMKENTHYTCELSELYIYCDNISDPGNLGTIIRTADAAGFKGVLLSPGCVDLYSPKTVRSSMGSFFNIDTVPDFDVSMLLDEKKKGFSLYCGTLRSDSVVYTEKDFTKPVILIVGNEANGVSEVISDNSEHIIIPIYGNAESLNASVAGAVMMYEAVRQRGGVPNGG